jgi:predicted alpha/beta superfamily hydrolase
MFPSAIKNFGTIFFFCIICISSNAQMTLTGVIKDSETNNSLPFVNIGIKKKNIGTTSLNDGSFSIIIPTQNENDTLTFSMVGYNGLNIPIKKILSDNQKSFQLKSRITELNTVQVSAKKLVEKKFGIKKEGALIHFLDGSTNQNDIFEIAQLIKLDSTPTKITSVNLHINDTRKDSGIFRINFYDYEGNRPTKRIVEKSILQTKEIKEGWLKFDLTKYNIYLKGNFIVAIEFFPTGKKNNPIYYEVKVGGPAKSFVRMSSQGEWTVPPHHYKLFITALVPDKKNKKQDDSEDKESIPYTTLYSKFVEDSFSIYVHLPKNYVSKKNQKFPVIYLLDANVYFDIIADALDENKNNSILIGIGYKNILLMDSLRNRDYTFPKSTINSNFRISGGGKHFLDFIDTELIVFINNSFRTDTSNQTLMGHSLGGYFVLYAMNQAILNKDNTFKNFVAPSASLEYSNNYLFKQFQNISIVNTGLKTLFISYGGREDSEEGGTGTEGMDNFKTFVQLLSDERFKNIKLKSEIYPKFGHMETAVPTFTKSLLEIK